MSSCLALTKNLNPGCASLKAIGGADRRIWIGSIADFDAFTFGSGINGLTSFTMKATKLLVRFLGKRLKNTANIALEDGENVMLRNHSVVFAAYAQTAAEKKALDELIDQESVLCFVETNSGQINVYGLALAPFNPDNFGLKATAGEGSIGTLINDPNVFTLTLSGQVPNLELVYGTGVLATDIAALDTLSVALS